MKRSAVVALSLALMSWLGCRAGGPSAPHANLGDTFDPLRSSFNAEVGKVRVLMLVAPT